MISKKLTYQFKHNLEIIMKGKVANEQPLSRTQMLSWINKTLSITETKIQNLGTGVIYCVLLNCFHPGTIPINRIIMLPRNHHDYRTNIRRLQEGLTALQLKSITFDVMKLTEMAFHQNWNLICKLYKHFTHVEKDKRESVHDGEKQKQPLKEQWWNPISSKVGETHKGIESHKVTQLHKGHENLYGFHQSVLQTPMKSLKLFDQNGKIRHQSSNLLDQIKKIVTSQSQTDKIKVKSLKKMLGLQVEDNADQDKQMKDLLSDFKKKEEVIQLD